MSKPGYISSKTSLRTIVAFSDNSLSSQTASRVFSAAVKLKVYVIGSQKQCSPVTLFCAKRKLLKRTSQEPGFKSLILKPGQTSSNTSVKTIVAFSDKSLNPLGEEYKFHVFRSRSGSSKARDYGNAVRGSGIYGFRIVVDPKR